MATQYPVDLTLTATAEGLPDSVAADARAIDAVDAVVLSLALRSGRLGRSAPTRAAAAACLLGAVLAVAVQLRDTRRPGR